MPTLSVLAGVRTQEDATLCAENFGPPFSVALRGVCLLGPAISARAVAACLAGRLATSWRQMPEVTAIA
jgi:hypothetical protein